MAQAVYAYDCYDHIVGEEERGKERRAHAGNDAMKEVPGNECEEETFGAG